MRPKLKPQNPPTAARRTSTTSRPDTQPARLGGSYGNQLSCFNDLGGLILRRATLQCPKFMELAKE